MAVMIEVLASWTGIAWWADGRCLRVLLWSLPWTIWCQFRAFTTSWSEWFVTHAASVRGIVGYFDYLPGVYMALLKQELGPAFHIHFLN